LLTELLLSVILSTSFSIRTPNDVSKPLDYEYTVMAEKNDGNLTYFIKRDWERELGENYIDDILQINKDVGMFYGGIDRINKTSKDLTYTTYNLGFSHKSGFKVGASIMDKNILFRTSVNKSFIKDDLECIINLSLKTGFNDNEIISVRSEVKKWFGDRFNIFGLYNHEYYNSVEDFKFKIGIGVKL
jgi:hypothetical protein|tara:strand:- start:454 stop:1014 length:561 start_codon:yes stop_codon:yes gene_type:complete